MNEKFTTIKIWGKTLQKLRFIRAYTGKAIVQIIDELADNELAKVKNEKTNNWGICRESQGNSRK